MNTLQTIAEANAVEIPVSHIATIIGNSDETWSVDGRENALDITAALERAARNGKSHYRIAYVVNGKRQFDQLVRNRFYGKV